jgi:hypothetical protein
MAGCRDTHRRKISRIGVVASALAILQFLSYLDEERAWVTAVTRI